MNTFSKVLAITTIAFVGSASAMKTEPSWSGNGKDFAKGTADKVWGFKFKAMATEYGNRNFAKNDHAKKAAACTLGFAADRAYNSGNVFRVVDSVQNVDPELMKHFAQHYAISRGTEIAAENGYTLDWAANKCDVLPKGQLRDVVNPVARWIAEYATTPEGLILIGGFVGAKVSKD